MSSSPARCRRRRRRARRSGAALGLDPKRVYDDFDAMAKAEAARPDGIEAVAIVTPNHMHAGPILAFLGAGIHVICDKPLTTSLAEARRIKAAVGEIRPHLRADPQLHRLSAGAAGARDGRSRRDRRHSPRPGRISAGVADRADREAPAEAGGLARRSAAVRAPAARSATSAPTPIISPTTSAASNSSNWPPSSPRSATVAQLDDNAQVLLRYANGARGALWVEPGRARQRERPAAARLWDQGLRCNGGRRTPTFSCIRRSASRRAS